MIADDHQDSVSKATHILHPLTAKHAAGRASFYICALQVLNKALAGEEIANFEFVLRTRQGQLLEILLNATPRQPTRAAQRWHALVAAHCDCLWMD